MIFLEPIMKEIGMKVSEAELKDAYIYKVVLFRSSNLVMSRSGMLKWIMSRMWEYKALDDSIRKHLAENYPSATDLTDKVIEKLRKDGFIFE